MNMDKKKQTSEVNDLEICFGVFGKFNGFFKGKSCKILGRFWGSIWFVGDSGEFFEGFW